LEEREKPKAEKEGSGHLKKVPDAAETSRCFGGLERCECRMIYEALVRERDRVPVKAAK